MLALTQKAFEFFLGLKILKRNDIAVVEMAGLRDQP